MGPSTSDPLIVDPRGLSLDASGILIYLTGGDDRASQSLGRGFDQEQQVLTDLPGPLSRSSECA